jgi:hypothetical protein
VSEGLSREEVHDAIDRAVSELLDEQGVGRPPVDAVALAGRLGVAVEARRGRGREDDEGGPPEHRQWLAAVALWSRQAPAVLARLGVAPEERRGLSAESLPELFARRLLVPTPWLRDEAAACGHDLLALKAIFATANHEVIAWRMLDLPEPCIITLIDNGRVSRRKSNAWRPPRELSGPERRCREQVSRYSRACEVSEGAWRVQGWPVHQADWKREVLRSVVEEGELE